MTRSSKKNLARSLVDGDPGTVAMAEVIAMLRKQPMANKGNGYPRLPLTKSIVLQFHPLESQADDEILVLAFPAGSNVVRYAAQRFTVAHGRKSVTVEVTKGRLVRVGVPSGFGDVGRAPVRRRNIPQGNLRAVDSSLWR